MFTEKALLKAKIDLYNILANHSAESYEQTNYRNGKRISKKHIPYSLNYDAETAKEMYSLVYGKNSKDITEDQEEQIKGYLLNYRLNRTKYLQEGYKGGNWRYS